MKHTYQTQRQRILTLLLWGALLVSCMPPATLPPALTLPPAPATKGPAIPFANPNLLGRQETHIRAIADTEALLRCLDSGQTVYGIALQNSNVRVAPEVNACRVGRIPKGNLVRITSAIDLRVKPTNQANQVLLPTPTPDATAVNLGFVEDIQPLFKRSCTACHSAVVKNLGLQVTAYRPLLAGSTRGAVVVPGNAKASKLWQVVDAGKMPLTGPLPANEKNLIRDWINAGALEKRPVAAPPVATAEPENRLWLEVNGEDMNTVNSQCASANEKPAKVVSSDLIFPLSCGVAPRPPELLGALRKLAITPATVSAAGAAPLASNPVGAPKLSPSGTASGGGGIQAATLGLPPPSDEDGWLQPQGGFCLEQRFAENQRGITAMTFAPDGRLFLALDQDLTDEPDPLILYDAHHPSRSVAVYDGVNKSSFAEILTESSRIAGMTYSNGALYLNRAGEVGRIADGGKYEPLAGGFAVNSQLFHANNGIAAVDGWLYVSAGGVIDGYSDGPIENIPESAAQSIVSAGNGFAARLVRAPLDQLLGQRSINAFQTAARGLRNPYGLTVDPSGRLWFTDNGATNVPENVSAGDEVNLFDPRSVAPGTGEDATPYYGFPLAITLNPPDWYAKPVVALPNTSAPTSLTWAYGTIFFGQYGRDPGLYRLGRAGNGQVIAERIMVAWPLLATATAPDGALWIGTGAGDLFRMTPGCG